jgi:hypothetical protein
VVSGLTDADLVKINAMIFEPYEEFIKKHRVFGASEQEQKDRQKDWQQEYDLLCAKCYQWYQRAWKRIGKRIQAHFIATQDGGPLEDSMRLVVHVYPYRLFPTRDDAKKHFGFCFCSTTVEDHGDAGLIVMHNLTPLEKRAAGEK